MGPGMTQDGCQPSLSPETSKFPAAPPSLWPPGVLARCTRRCPALRSAAPRRSTGKQFSPLWLLQVAGGPQQSCWEKPHPPAPPRAPRRPLYEFKGVENRGQATNNPQQLLPQDRDTSGSPSRSHAAWGWGRQPSHPHPHHGCRPRRRADSSQDSGRSHPLLCPNPGGPPSSAQPPGK